MSCSHQSSSPLEVKKYQNDLVTVQTAIDLARSSYLKGCSDKSSELKEKGFFKKCLIKAKKHIQEDVIFVLDQGDK